MKKYIFHLGSVYIYIKDDKLKALADIDNVYHKCRKEVEGELVFSLRCYIESIDYC